MVKDDERFLNESEVMIGKQNSVYEDIDIDNDGIEDNRIIKENTIHILEYPAGFYEKIQSEVADLK